MLETSDYTMKSLYGFTLNPAYRDHAYKVYQFFIAKETATEYILAINSHSAGLTPDPRTGEIRVIKNSTALNNYGFYFFTSQKEAESSLKEKMNELEDELVRLFKSKIHKKN